MATSTIALLLALGAAALVLLGLWWSSGVRRDATGGRRLGIGVVVPLAVALLALFTGQLAFGVAVGFTAWQLMSVVYLDLVVAVPVIAGTVVVSTLVARTGRDVPRATTPVLVLCAVALLAAPLGWWSTRVGPYRLQVDEVALELPEARAGAAPVRVGVVSDIQTTHIGAHERRAVAEVMALQPDLVLVAGDVFQGSRAQLEANRSALRDLFAQMGEAPAGVYVVVGDVDTARGLAELLDGTPARLLVDEVVEVEVRDRTIALGGVSLEPTPASRVVLEQLAARPPAQVGIVLGHRPDWVLEAPGGAVDLVVAGHTHGGQVAVPGFGPLMTMSNVPRDVAAGGLHEVGGTDVYVSTGIGREQQGAPQIRFLVDPSVAVVELR